MRFIVLLCLFSYFLPTKSQPWAEKEKWFSGISASLEELDSEERDRLFNHSDSPEILLQIKRRRAFYVYTSSWASMTTILKGKVSYSGDSLSIYFNYRKITSDDVQIRIRGINGYRRIKNQMAVRRFKAHIWNNYGEWKLTENGGHRENFYESRNTQLKRSKFI
jgi:hypothetical protein